MGACIPRGSETRFSSISMTEDCCIHYSLAALNEIYIEGEEGCKA